MEYFVTAYALFLTDGKQYFTSGDWNDKKAHSLYIISTDTHIHTYTYIYLNVSSAMQVCVGLD